MSLGANVEPYQVSPTNILITPNLELPDAVAVYPSGSLGYNPDDENLYISTGTSWKVVGTTLTGLYTNLTAGYILVTSLTALTEVNTNLTSLNAFISNLICVSEVNTNLTSLNAFLSNMSTLNAYITNLTAINEVNTSLTSLNAFISNLTSINETFTNITSVNAFFSKLTALTEVNTNLTSLNAFISNITAIVEVNTNLTSLSALISNLTCNTLVMLPGATGLSSYGILFDSTTVGSVNGMRWGTTIGGPDLVNWYYNGTSQLRNDYDIVSRHSLCNSVISNSNGTLGPGAGSGSFSLSGTEEAHTLTINSGGTTTENSVIFTFTYNNAYPTGSICHITSANLNASKAAGVNLYIVGSTTGYVITEGATAALTTTDAYIWNIFV